MFNRYFRTGCVIVTLLALVFGAIFITSPSPAASEQATGGELTGGSGNADVEPEASEASGALATGAAPSPSKITLTVTLTTPNGGEILVAGTNHTIMWTSGGGNGSISITLRYSTMGRSGPQGLINDSLPNTGSFIWLVPNAPSEDCYVNITAKDSTSPIPEQAVDDSNSNFTIKALPLNVKVLAPNGGENWTAGLPQTIQWAITGGFGTLHAKVEYSVDNGVSYTVIDPDVVGKNFTSWTVPDTGVTKIDCLVRVTATDSASPPGSKDDTSDAVFMIYVPPLPPLVLTLSAPSGGEMWEAGSKQYITWTITGGRAPYSDVKLEYSIDGVTGTYLPITTSGKGGSYEWTLPWVPDTCNYSFIRATVSDNESRTNVTTNSIAFYITVPELPSVSLITPNGGETWGVGQKHNITWTVSGGVAPLKATLKYTTQGVGGSYSEIIKNIDALLQHHEWVVPNFESTNCYIWLRVTDSYKGGARNVDIQSCSAFKIASLPAPPTVSILAPVGGEKWSVGYDYTIRWNRSGGQGPFSTTIAYSIDGVAYWTISASATDNAGASSYKWTIPSDKVSLTSSIRIRVTDNYMQETEATSGQFEITSTPPPQEGRIEGTVLDEESAAPISGATVVINEKQYEYLRTTTDNKGYFIISKVPVGSRSIKVTKADYKDLVAYADVVRDTTTSVGEITMTKAPKTPTPPWMILTIAVIILVVVIALVAGLVTSYRRKARQEEEKPQAVWVDPTYYKQQQQAYEPPARGTGALPTEIATVKEDDRYMDKDTELDRLQTMKEKEILSDEEYEFAKKRVLEKDAKQQAIIAEAEKIPEQQEAPAEGAPYDYGAAETAPAPDVVQEPSREERPTPRKTEVSAPEPERAEEPEPAVADEGDLVAIALARAGMLRKKKEKPSVEAAREDGASGEVDILTLSELAKLEEQKRDGKMSDEDYEKRKKELRGGK